MRTMEAIVESRALLEEKVKKLADGRAAMIHMLKSLDKTNRELAVARDYVDNIITSVIDTLIVVDPDARIKTVNKATTDLLGYTERKLIGKPVGVIFAEEEEEEEEEESIFKGTKLEKLIKKGSIKNYEMTYKTKSGRRIPVNFSGSVMRDKDGRLVGIVGVARDMRRINRLMEKEKKFAVMEAAAEVEKKKTEELQKVVASRDQEIAERKKAEETLRRKEKTLRRKEEFNEALFEYNPIETMVVDHEGRITQFNLAKKRSGDRLPDIGDIMYKDYAGKHKIDMHGELLKCIKKGKAKEFPELEYGDKFLAIAIAPFSGGAIITSKNITAHKKAEEKIKQEKEKGEELVARLDAAYEKLKAAQDELVRREKLAATGALAAGVAHEVRNPLAIIGMTVQYLQSKLHEKDPKRELTEAIVSKVEGLDKVTRELSSYGRAIKLNIQRCSLKKCLNSNLALIKSKCRVQRIKIKKHYSFLPLIRMDEEQMDKVFLNIMDNAIKAMPRGGVLTVSTRLDERSKRIIIKFHNTGSSIHKRHIPRIFEPFYTLRKKGRGTGLGLAICQNVVIRHGGQIQCESKPSGKDRGVTFTIRLPLHPPPRKIKKEVGKEYEEIT